ncbi:hypothetical protein WME89_41520 [Sorangium sp. So ce321]|uniref:hypothetical protein n=1 Tax=Sorangium sp. So ce321 TaxID=3133300 RepID=UPI003F62E680
MLERTICIIPAALLTGCGAASPGAEVNGAEANEPPGGLEERYIYDGEVAIEPVALDVMIDRLLRIGCVRAPAANSWCPVSVADFCPSPRDAWGERGRRGHVPVSTCRSRIGAPVRPIPLAHVAGDSVSAGVTSS